MPEEPTTPHLIEPMRKFVDAAHWIGSYEDFEIESRRFSTSETELRLRSLSRQAGPLASTGHVSVRLALVTAWADGMVVRVITSRDIDEARATAERLAQERG